MLGAPFEVSSAARESRSLPRRRRSSRRSLASSAARSSPTWSACRGRIWVMSCRPLGVRNTRETRRSLGSARRWTTPIALGAVDQPREVPRRDEHPPAQRGERLPVLALEVREEVEAGHRRRVGEATTDLAEHHVVALEEADPEADVVSPRRPRNPTPLAVLERGPAHRGESGSIATPSISTSAPGSRRPATLTRLIAG